jgi:hypothetical protein
MAHFAKLDTNNVVIAVVAGRDEDEGKENELTARTGDVYKQTSYNTRGGVHYQLDGTPSSDQSKSFRKNYAGIGYTYQADIDAFVPPQPFPSWTLNLGAQWEPPVAMPTDGKMYSWDEDTASWVEHENQP